MREPLITLTGVTTILNAQPVLRDLTFAVPAGQTLALIGESGCGKTVLLKHIVGLLPPTHGTITFAGKALPAQTVAERMAMRRRVGFLFQAAALFDSLTVYENVAYPLRALHNLDEATIRTRVRQRLDEVGLASTADAKKPAELSGGMRKRVGLARALALDPDVMLYDEPTTGLDPVMIGVINDLINQTRQRRAMTSIIVTHELKTVQAVAERVVMLAPLAPLEATASQLLFDGSVSDLLASTDPRLQRFIA